MEKFYVRMFSVLIINSKYMVIVKYGFVVIIL